MTFEFDAQRYQRASAHQQEWGQRLIAELDLRGHERILDVGCGDGSLTRTLAAGVPRGSVLGLDASVQMVAAARGLEGPNLQFVRMDILDADFRDEFDVVFSSATLHWVHDHGRLLEVLYRAVKPGGVVRLSFAGEGNCSHLIAVLRELMVEPAYRAAFGGFAWPWYMPPIEDYERLVRQAAPRALHQRRTQQLRPAAGDPPAPVCLPALVLARHQTRVRTHLLGRPRADAGNGLQQ